MREQHQPKRKKSKRAGKNSLCVQGCFRVCVGVGVGGWVQVCGLIELHVETIQENQFRCLLLCLLPFL